MKPAPYYIVVALSAGCLLLSISSIWVGQSTRGLQEVALKQRNEIQAELQRRQAEVTKGNESNRIGLEILKDMAVAAQKNEKIKALLEKNGYSLAPATSSTSSK